MTTTIPSVGYKSMSMWTIFLITINTTETNLILDEQTNTIQKQSEVDYAKQIQQ